MIDDNSCNTHGPTNWSSECKSCVKWDMKKLADKERHDVTDAMFSVLCKDMNLKTGDMSPEDTMALDGIIERFIDGNKEA